jgi:Abnormal spindle-like microcephaly-assoc'd, ASPM-SPD-2-Hydin/Fungal fucose-specific lectin
MVAKKTPGKKAPAKKAVKAPAKKTPVARKASAPAKKAAPPKKAPAAPKEAAPPPVPKKSRRIGNVMRTIYDADLRATVTVDDADRIRALNHEEYWPAGDLGGREAASAYFGDIASKLDISAAALSSLNEPVSFFDPRQQDVEYRFSEEKSSFDTATYAFYQTYLNTPVWTSGLTVTVKQGPTRVVAATNTSEQGIDAQMPTTDAVERYRQLFLTGEKAPSLPRRRRSRASKVVGVDGSALLDDILAEPIRASNELSEEITPQLIRGRFFVYRFDAEKRTTDHPQQTEDDQDDTRHDPPLCGTAPELPLPPVPNTIQDDDWYLVAELIVRLPYHENRMNWRFLVELETNAILYARALTSGVNGLVFTYDPITGTGTATNTPDQGNAVLDPLRDDVLLPNLNAPIAGVQSLQGSLVTLDDIEILTVAAPTQPTGSDFDYAARTNEFAAVNAYYHNNRFFEMVADLGFPLATYFDGTAFPVEVDHRGFGNATDMGNIINAHCIGDGDGIDHACYALAEVSNTANPMGIATDWRVVLHELGGHGILYDHVNSANFGFSHSAGDSFAMILNDYSSAWHTGAAIDRFLLTPFVPAIARRSDRTVAAGWGWGGANDDGGYSSEQILSTTMFRVYRSIGGDSSDVSRREFAARYMAYLMLRAVGTLTPMSNPSTPALFLTALLTADAGNWTSEGVFGGAYGKVLVWSFEEQNLNGGAVPAVDVYIDDGRAGEYEYLPVHWETPTVWNRLNPDGIAGHQEPAGTTNYAYVKVKNRGTSIANDVIVRGYHCKPSAGLSWPGDIQPMTTAQLAAGTLQPNNAEEKTIGPFAWTPATNASGNDSMLMVVSAAGDPSNIDNFTAGEAIEDWRLVPNDNNIALRNVVLVRLALVIADSGDVGNVCVGSFKDIVLYLSNSGFNTITITGITSSSGEFLVPSVLSYPLVIEPGNVLEAPIRFQPSSFGSKSSTISVLSNDPTGPKTVVVSGTAPAPRLTMVVPDNGDFGEVRLGRFTDRDLIINNSGPCQLSVTGIVSSAPIFVTPQVASFPITVDGGDSVAVPIRFEPTNRGSATATLTIVSNDPNGPAVVNVSGTAWPPLPVAGTALEGFRLNTDSQHVFFIGTDKYVHELDIAAGGIWDDNDLTTLAGAVPPIPTSALAGFRLSNDSKHVYFIGTDNHAYELYFTVATGWVFNDLTSLAHAVRPAANSAIDGHRLSDDSKHVFFIGTDNHVHELFIAGGGRWADNDLTALAGAGAKPPTPTSALTSYRLSDDSQHVLFIGTDNHVHELFIDGGSWADNDLTALAGAGAVPPIHTSALTGYPLSNDSQHVFFIGTDSHVHELDIAGAGWNEHDLTTLAGAVAPTPSSGLTGYRLGDNSKHVFFIGTDNHVHELFIAGAGWLDNDLTALT